jgi:hypothetical protein
VIPIAFKTSEVAKKLNLSVQVVRSLCERKEFPGARRITTGKRSHWIIPAKALEQWFEPKQQEQLPVDRKSRHDSLRIYNKSRKKTQ